MDLDKPTLDPASPPNDRLPPCPSTPNCVSSEADDPQHLIAPIAFIGDPQRVWRSLIAYLESESSYTIVEQQPGYLRAEARTRWLRFVDDVEFRLRHAESKIAMRSASRIGYSDFGTNRRRLEAVRRALQGTA